jgi:hypothetical protein
MKKPSWKYLPLGVAKSNTDSLPEPCQSRLFFHLAQLFRFSDWLDITLISLGIVISFISSFLFASIFLLFGQIVQILVELLKIQAKCTKYLINSTNSSANSQTDGAQQVEILNSERIDLYLNIGLACMALNYLAYVCISSAAERQIKRIK